MDERGIYANAFQGNFYLFFVRRLTILRDVETVLTLRWQIILTTSLEDPSVGFSAIKYINWIVQVCVCG